MLVKFNADERLVDRLKAATGARVASKAFESAGDRYISLTKQVVDLQLANDRLQQIIDVYVARIDAARDAATLLLERVSQDDLFC